MPEYGRTEGSDVRETVQAKLVQLGLLQPNTAGASWELTQLARDLLSSTLTSPHKSKLAADLLKLGMIEPGAMGSGPWWVFTPRGRNVMTYLLNNPVPLEEQVEALRRELQELREEFLRFRRQLEGS